MAPHTYDEESDGKSDDSLSLLPDRAFRKRWGAPQIVANTQRSSGSYFKIWPDFLGLMGGSGGPRGPGKALKNAGAVGPHIFEGFPGPPGPPRPPP